MKKNDEELLQAAELFIKRHGVTKCPPCLNGSLPQYDLEEVPNKRIEKARRRSYKPRSKAAQRNGLKGAQANHTIKHLPISDN